MKKVAFTTVLALAASAAVFFIHGEASAYDEEIYTMKPPVMPNVMMYLSDNKYLYRRAYTYSPANVLLTHRCPNSQGSSAICCLWANTGRNYNSTGRCEYDHNVDGGCNDRPYIFNGIAATHQSCFTGLAHEYINCTGTAAQACAYTNPRETCCDSRCPTDPSGNRLCNIYYWGLGKHLYDTYCNTAEGANNATTCNNHQGWFNFYPSDCQDYGGKLNLLFPANHDGIYSYKVNVNVSSDADQIAACMIVNYTDRASDNVANTYSTITIPFGRVGYCTDYDCYPIDAFNFYSSTIYTALQAMLAYRNENSTYDHGTMGLLLNRYLGLDSKYGLTRFNYYRSSSTICSGSGDCYDGQGGCPDIPVKYSVGVSGSPNPAEDSNWDNPHRVARAIKNITNDQEDYVPFNNPVDTGIPPYGPPPSVAKNNHMKINNPVSNVYAELKRYLSNSYTGSQCGAGSIYGASSLDQLRAPWETDPSYQIANRSFLSSNAFVMSLVFGDTTDNNTNTLANAKALWDNDQITDADGSCPYPDRSSNCKRQSSAVDVISISATSDTGWNFWTSVASSTQGRHFMLPAASAHGSSGTLDGRYHLNYNWGDGSNSEWNWNGSGWAWCNCCLCWPLNGDCEDMECGDGSAWTLAGGNANSAIVGYDCSSQSNPACWTGLSEAFLALMNSYDQRNVNTSRSFSMVTPVVYLDKDDPYDCYKNFYFTFNFQPTPGAMFQGNVVGYPYGAQEAGPGGVNDQTHCPLTSFMYSSTTSSPFLESGGTLKPDATGILDVGVALAQKSSARSIYTNITGETTRRALSDGAINSTVLGLQTGADSRQTAYIKSQVTDGIASKWYFGAGTKFNTYNWRLGDIQHSQPVVVHRPNPYYSDIRIDQLGLAQQKADPAYQAFVKKYTITTPRPPVLYVSSNDGAVHAFNLTLGTSSPSVDEQWAWVPSFALAKLRYLTPTNMMWETVTYDSGYSGDVSDKQYILDASPAIADVWIDSDYNGTTQFPDNTASKSCDGLTNQYKCSTEWKTYLVSGMGKGTTGIFGLDITDYTNPSLAFEFQQLAFGGTASLNNSKYLAQTTSDPIIGKILVCDGNCTKGTAGCMDGCKDNTKQERWVAIFGAGYNTGGDPADIDLGYCHDRRQTNCNPSSSYKIFRGRALIVIDLMTKQKLFEYGYDAVFNTDDNSTAACITNIGGDLKGPSAVYQPHCMRFALAGPPAGVDYNGDGFLDAVYIGDLGGQLWRFDFSQYGSIDNTTKMVTTCGATGARDGVCWSGRVLFHANSPAETKCSGGSDDNVWYRDTMLDCNDQRCALCNNPSNPSLSCQTNTARPNFDCGDRHCAWECKACWADSSWPIPVPGHSTDPVNPDQTNVYGYGAGRNWRSFWSAPTVAQDNFGRWYVFVGSGDRGNILSTAPRKYGIVFGVYDELAIKTKTLDTAWQFPVEEYLNETATDLTHPKIRKVTTNQQIYDVNGWYRVLANAGEKVLFPTATVANDVYYTSFRPALEYNSGYQINVLERAYIGDAYLYVNDFLTGGAPLLSFGSKDFWAGTQIGQDIPSAPKVIARAPNASHPAGETAVVIHTGAGQVQQIKAASSKYGRNILQPVSKVIYWRESL